MNPDTDTSYDHVSASKRSQQYTEYCESIRDTLPDGSFEYKKGINPTKLSKNTKKRKKIDLFDTLDKRITTRSFSGESISIDDIGIVLYETFFYRNHLLEKFSEKGLETFTKRRSSPSGGSLQCCEAYLIARNVRGVNSGIYHYGSHNNSLGFISKIEKDIKFGSDYLIGQTFSDDADAFIVITSRMEKMWWKYSHSRAYRVACLDVGHLSQTAQLIATGLGLRTWITAAFCDEKIRKLLDIQQESAEFPMLVLGFGTGEIDPIDKYLPCQSIAQSENAA